MIRGCSVFGSMQQAVHMSLQCLATMFGTLTLWVTLCGCSLNDVVAVAVFSQARGVCLAPIKLVYHVISVCCKVSWVEAFCVWALHVPLRSCQEAARSKSCVQSVWTVASATC